MAQEAEDRDEAVEAVIDETRAPVTGLVAEVVSDREVLLNRGAEDGVEVGMYFAIHDPDTIDVTDPETGKSLGGIKRVRVVVRAEEVAEHLTLAATFLTKEVNLGGTGALGFQAMFQALQEPNWVQKTQRLKRGPNDPKKITPAESIVERGYPFEEVDEEDSERFQSIVLAQHHLNEYR